MPGKATAATLNSLPEKKMGASTERHRRAAAGPGFLH
jgi:hypothetical protein